MLSQELLSLKTWFNACRHGTHEMTAVGAEAFSLALDDCVEQAIAMEMAAADLRPADATDPLAGEIAAGTGSCSLDPDELLAQARAMANATNIVLLYTSRPAFTDAPRGGAA